MKLTLPALMLTLSACINLLSNAQAAPIDKDAIQVMNQITATSNIRPYQSAFPEPIRQNLISQISQALDQRQAITIFGEHHTWQPLSKLNSLTEPGLQIIKLNLSNDQFSKGTLTLTGIKQASLYLNGQAVKGKQQAYQLQLPTGDHRIVIVTEQVDNWKAVELDWDSAQQTTRFTSQAVPQRLSASKLYDSQQVSGIKLSPDGKQLIWTKRSRENQQQQLESLTELVDVKTQKVTYRWQGMTPSNISWSPDNRFFSYTHQHQLYLFDRHSFQLTRLAQQLTAVSNFSWLDQNTLIFNWKRSDDSQSHFAKRYRALEDRWSGWRDNSQVYQIDRLSGMIQQLTDSKNSYSILDIDRKQQRLLLLQNPSDYGKPPHILHEVYELTLGQAKPQLIGEYRYLSAMTYAKKGFYLVASPDFADGLGRNKQQISNSYDGQLYHISRDGKISALSKNFVPAISSLTRLSDGNLLLSVQEKDRKQLYNYQTKRQKFNKINTELDIVSSYSSSQQRKPSLVYLGSNADKPQRVYFKPGGKDERLLLDSSKTSYRNQQLTKVVDWPYQNKLGQTIDGRYHLPANFDANKKYPLIVYYYGGVVPASRSFSGRWPANLWAANGYVVYVVQPSGAIGYGQDFSAKHVNAWGIETAADIIESSQAFIKAHDFVDGSKVGNMGASYGGFMSMYLATQSDIFSATISHAGISNLSSYWGHGWWGYLYSGIASHGSFPWNNRQLYTEQSPLYLADKINNPLLLLHGDADTNVPVSESHQMYTALKLLDKEVDLIEYAGDDHHINQRDHRIHWWHTIIAYMDHHLKGQSLWWQTLYPEAE